MSSVFLQRAFLQTLTQLFAWSKVHFEFVEVTDSLHCSSFFGLANFACRVLERNRKKKELQWRLSVLLFWKFETVWNVKPANRQSPIVRRGFWDV